MTSLAVALLLLFAVPAGAFVGPAAAPTALARSRRWRPAPSPAVVAVVVPPPPRPPSRLRLSDASSFSDDDEDEEEEEQVEPGKMRVSEIKAELGLRGVGYADCFDKESLASRLLEARATGRADPSIIDQFNKKKLEENFGGTKVDISDEDMRKAVGGDGTLPGGMPPDMLKKLMANPELMVLLQSPKMQEAMKLMMTDGQEALEKAMEEDREVYEVIMKLNKVMADAQ